jgi:competence protein ComEC
MPALLWVALGFVAGDLAGLLFFGVAWILAPAAALAGGTSWRRMPRAAIALTGAAAGLVWGAVAATRASRNCRAKWREGERVAVIVGLWDVPAADGASRTRVWWPAACAGPLTVAWPGGGRTPRTAAVVVGTWHRSAARVASSWPARPERAGRLVARHVRPLAISPGWRAALRLASEQRIASLFGPPRAALAVALTVGAGDQLDAEVRRRFARAGIAHILAISGLHVGILAAALLLVLRAARLGDVPSRLAATGLVAAYVWLLGMPPPALRALGLLALWCWARLRQRPPVPYASLAATALVVLALDPFAAVEAGPWLSFAGAAGCVVAARQWSVLRRQHSVLRSRRAAAALSVAAISGGATLATAPVSILAFGTMSPAALISNVLAIPIAGFVMPALALTLGFAAILPVAAPLAAAATSVGLDALNAVAGLAGTLPLASVAFERRVGAATVLAVVAGTLLRPLRSTGRRGAARTLGVRAILAGALALGAWVWWPLTPGTPSGDSSGALALHFLAVGQGDAAVVRTPAGRWLVVDGGPRLSGFDAGASVVAPFLRHNGVERVAVVVASHGDGDHLGGLPAVVRAFRPELVLEPGQALATPGYARWLAAVARAGSRWRRARAGDSVALDGVVLRVLHPDSAWLERRLPANENSVVVSLEYGAFRALFPGDAGLAAESAPDLASRLSRATVLKVAHHGSRLATGPAFLSAVAPRVCVISVGPNRYGQPDPGLVASLERAGCLVFRTDQGGAVTVQTDGRTVRAHNARQDTTLILTREQP